MVELIVKRGTCHALYVFDVGLGIDLEKVRRLLARDVSVQPATSRRGPKYYGGYQPPPLHLIQQTSCAVLGAERTLKTELLLYDFGAVTVRYEIPFEGSLATAGEWSCRLSAEDPLASRARESVKMLLEKIAAAVRRPHHSDLMEDYLMFEFREVDSPCSLDQLPARYGAELARILRAEAGALSAQQIADALSIQLSYGPDDLTLIDWNAAVIFDREAEDVLDVLEFANIELLELRVLDAQLDASLDQSYEMLANLSWQRLLGISELAGLRRVGQMQVDAAILFERFSNALKLLGDEYLARVYRAASQRFHLPEWNTSTLRKLETFDSLYRKLSDRNASRRLEILEWIIILLIAFEIVWSLWGPRGGG